MRLTRNKTRVLQSYEPIEHVWDLLGTRLESYNPKNLNKVREHIKEEWSKISEVDVQKLILSMLEHVIAVIIAKGGHTKY